MTCIISVIHANAKQKYQLLTMALCQQNQLFMSSCRKQYARLSQKDGAAVSVSFDQKWQTGTGRQYFADIIDLSLTTVTQSVCKAIEFGEKSKGYYAVQGHSRSVPTESPYATSW